MTLRADATATGGRVREAPRVPARSLGGAAASVRDVLTTEGLSLRVLELRSGRCSLRAESEEELLLFVLAGRGLLRSAVGQDPLEPETAVLLAAGEHCELEGSLELVAVGVKAPLEQASGTAVRISRLAEQAAQAATAAREFRIVLDPACGCASATQFVGYIPVGVGARALSPLRRGDLRARGRRRDAHERAEHPAVAPARASICRPASCTRSKTAARG